MSRLSLFQPKWLILIILGGVFCFFCQRIYGQQLYAGSSWIIQAASDVGRGRLMPGDLSFALDGSNRPWIVYNSHSGNGIGDLKQYLGLARYENSAWLYETLFETVWPSPSPSGVLALDSQNRAHIVFFAIPSADSDTTHMKYFFYDGTAWSSPMSIDAGYPGDIAIDQESHLHLVYVSSSVGSYPEEIRKSLKYAYYNGSQWQTQTIESGRTIPVGTPVFTRPSIAVDQKNHVHISYKFSPHYDADVRYAYYDGRQWQIENIEHEAYPGDFYHDAEESPAIAIDGNNQPHISYYVKHSLRYAYKSSYWQIETVEDNISIPSTALYIDGYSSIAIDGNDQPHISYTGHRFLKYARKNSAWQIETVVSNADIHDNAIVLDKDNRPHIAYSDFSTLSLRYAYRSNIFNTPPQYPKQPLTAKRCSPGFY